MVPVGKYLLLLPYGIVVYFVRQFLIVVDITRHLEISKTRSCIEVMHESSMLSFLCVQKYCMILLAYERILISCSYLCVN